METLKELCDLCGRRESEIAVLLCKSATRQGEREQALRQVEIVV